ncbi:hypothetical protein [Flavobacterium anhuiense]|nr:hypothetical protein [Flavobacterium anhuiense]MCR4031434.1 hypothetical protein [Flavobacterium panacis]
MKTKRRNKRFSTDFLVESRKRKNRTINVMVLSIVGFIAVLLISKIT